MQNKKYLLFLGEAIVFVVTLAVYINDFLTPTLSDLLRKEEYTTIFESKNYSSKIWERHYSKFKKELVSENIFSAIDDKEGASKL